NDQELIARDEAARMFDLSDVNKAPAVFDPEKLLWMNGQHMLRMSADELYPHLVPFLGNHAKPLEELRPIIDLYKSRARTLKEMAAQMEPFFIDDDAIEYDAEAAKKHLKGDDLASRMNELHDVLAATEPFDVTTTE